MSPLAFDPSDPFPLSEKPPTYEEAKAHAHATDAWLGIDTARVELAIERRLGQAKPAGQQLWVGLPVETLLTPYTELRDILHRLSLPGGAQVIDLGAGYGRLGFVIARHGHGARFLGYELLEERVTEGRLALRRFGIPEDIADLKATDLADPAFRLPMADAYFIYDYGSRAAIAKTLADLQTNALRRGITVVGRGRLTRDEIERQQPWLSQIIAPEHCGNFSIYRSAPNV